MRVEGTVRVRGSWETEGAGRLGGRGERKEEEREIAGVGAGEWRLDTGSPASSSFLRRNLYHGNFH
jgi:hypothetical protein